MNAPHCAFVRTCGRGRLHMRERARARTLKGQALSHARMRKHVRKHRERPISDPALLTRCVCARVSVSPCACVGCVCTVDGFEP